MITISLEEKNAKLILNLLKSRMDDIDSQIKRLEHDKKEIEDIINNLNPKIENPLENPAITEDHIKIEKPAITEDHIKIENPAITENHIKIENPAITENHIKIENPIIKTGFMLEEIEFFEESMHEIKIGKNRIRRSEDGQKIYMERNGYRAHVKAKLNDLIYLQDHPSERENSISNLSKNKQSILVRFLKEIDFHRLDWYFQSCGISEDKKEIVKDDQIENDEGDQTSQEQKTGIQTIIVPLDKIT